MVTNIRISVGLIKVCSKCGTEKPIEEFSICDNGKRRRSGCKQCFAQHDRDRYIKQKAENIKLYRAAHTPDELRKGRERGVKRREWTLTLLGNKYTCCGEDIPERLTFDHIHGGEHKVGMSGAATVNEILKMESPASKYRLLCYNCNMSLRAYGYCSHQGHSPEEEPVHSKREPAKYRRQLNKRHKLEYIAEYGEKCQICGEDNWEFLTVDHTNGGGTQHRKELMKLGVKVGAPFYTWLKRQGYPKDKYQLLCCNCNAVKGIRELAEDILLHRLWGDYVSKGGC